MIFRKSINRQSIVYVYNKVSYKLREHIIKRVYNGRYENFWDECIQ